MIVEEKSNSIVVKMIEDEKFIEQLESVIKKYHIKEAWLRGFGFSKALDYGILEKSEPIFFKKIHTDKLVTISAMTSLVNDEQYTMNFNGIDIDGVPHIGRMFDLVVAHEFQVVIEILRTE
jgi:predicted DNA-binding protein with PD1-like motif